MNIVLPNPCEIREPDATDKSNIENPKDKSDIERPTTFLVLSKRRDSIETCQSQPLQNL